MLSLDCFESRLASLGERHHDMPRTAVSLVRLVIFLQRRIESRLAEVLEAHGLNHSAWSLLMMIYSDPRRALNPSLASDSLGQSRAHMTRMTDELAARDWVCRVQNADDRRAVEICLTAAGESAVQAILPVMWQTYERLVDGFPPGEAESLSRMLRGWLCDLEQAPLATAANDSEENE